MYDNDDEYDRLKDDYETGDSNRPMSHRQRRDYDDYRRHSREEGRYWG